MKCLIPVDKLDNLVKQINHIRNKGANVTFNQGSDIIMKKDSKGHYHKCVEVEAEGKYIINGWEFVATIEHKNNGNIIRCVDSSLESKIPSKYLTIGPECEHCHRIRDRKDTYLVYNASTNDWKQVGRSCLQEYTDGLDANTCTLLASIFNDLEDAVSDDNLLQGAPDKYFDSKYIKKLIFTIVKQFGYSKMGTDNSTVSLINKQLNPDSEDEIIKIDDSNDAEIEKMDAWVNSLPTDESDYFRNAKVAWQAQYVESRDFPLIASFINYYFKAQQLNIQRAAQEKHNQETTNYVGNVGEKITFKVASVKVLYQKDNSQYSYYAQPSNVYKLIDDKGNVYKWNTSADVNEGDTITATIKAHEEYRGERQTVITRGKIQ